MKQSLKFKTKYRFSLVKWDGDAPEDWKQIEKPENDPRCVEIVAWELGKPKQTTYKRGE